VIAVIDVIVVGVGIAVIIVIAVIVEIVGRLGAAASFNGKCERRREQVADGK
jgi:hypothetical protein